MNSIALAGRRSRRSAEGAPWLVCLNAQSDYVTQGRPLHSPHAAKTLRALCDCLAVARSLHWEIVHVRSWRPLNQKGFWLSPQKSAPGLEPHANEKLIRKSSFSAFDAPDFHDQVEDLAPSRIFVAGFGLASDGIAMAFDASKLGWAMTILEDVVCTPPIGSCSSAQVFDVAVSLLASVVDIAQSDEVFGRRSQVFGGNHD